MQVRVPKRLHPQALAAAEGCECVGSMLAVGLLVEVSAGSAVCC